MDPLTMLYAGSTIAGGLGSLFGSKDRPEQIHPELQRLMGMMEQDYRNPAGMNTVILEQMRRKLKQTLGNEAGALGAMNTANINRQGGGAAAQNASMGRLNSQRLGAIGSGMVDIDVGNENLKQQQSQSALSALMGIMPQLGYEQTGQGYGSLFGAGLYGLMQPRTDGQKDFKWKEAWNKWRPRYDPNKWGE